MSAMEVTNLTVDTLNQLFEAGKRFDGRGLLDHRDLEVSLDVSNKAEGSARVKLGKTEVIVGVKLQVGTPYSDSPDKGSLMVSGDLLPLASPRYESGPPKFKAIELPRVIDRGIRESGMIDFSKLVVTKGEKVWTVIVDLYPINDDGNIIDACGIGAIVALRNAMLPELDKDGNIDYSKKSKTPLPLAADINPIPFTFYKLGDSIILDPTREEEESCETRITIGISKWNKQYMVNSAQKSGGGLPLTQEDMQKMFDLLPQKLDEINKKLKKFL